ncbi:MAG TPA: class I SAM-dependent methyltransferase [Candidatus Methylomirabilis sp.]|nr:class I SAM-dependent methyltransferase [Candidatus Methylomirabilis sp.]
MVEFPAIGGRTGDESPLIDLYACPSCGTALARGHADQLICATGEHLYPIVVGVPDLRELQLRPYSESVLLDVARWSAARRGRDPWRRPRAHAWAALLRMGEQIAPPPGVFVDLGAGKGELAQAAGRLGYRAIAIDLAAPPACPGVERARGNLEALPLSSASVHVLAMSASLHYARDPVRALWEARRVLTDDGVLLITLTPVNDTPSGADLAAEHTRRAIRAAGGTGPLATGYRHLVASDLRAVLQATGFTVTEQPSGLGWMWETRRRIQGALNGYELARFPLLIARPLASRSQARAPATECRG